MSSSNNHLAPPSGPPPPEVPPGWIARWDPRYQTFFYVNLATKQSQWDKPPGTIDRPGSSSSSAGDYYDSRPPPYSSSSTPNLRSTDHSSHNPQPQYSSLIPPDNHLPAHQPAPRVTTPDHSSSSKRHGLTAKIGKFLDSRAAAAAARPRYPMYAQSHYGYPGRPMYGGYGGGMYGNPMMMGGHRRGGLGAGGGAALGLGGGLLGGMMLADAMDNDYQDGFQDGANFGDDYGGGDFGGGDFGGGDFGGGDF